MDYFRLRGTGVSPGISIGEVQLTAEVIFTSRKELILPLETKAELGRLGEALDRTRKQLIPFQHSGSMGREKTGKRALFYLRIASADS